MKDPNNQKVKQYDNIVSQTCNNSITYTKPDNPKKNMQKLKTNTYISNENNLKRMEAKGNGSITAITTQTRTRTRPIRKLKVTRKK